MKDVNAADLGEKRPCDSLADMQAGGARGYEAMMAGRRAQRMSGGDEADGL